jgi:hypothetical protein
VNETCACGCGRRALFLAAPSCSSRPAAHADAAVREERLAWPGLEPRPAAAQPVPTARCSCSSSWAETGQDPGLPNSAGLARPTTTSVSPSFGICFGENYLEYRRTFLTPRGLLNLSMQGVQTFCYIYTCIHNIIKIIYMSA